MLLFSVFILFLLSVPITVHVMNECDKSHNCLTCIGVPYHCASCPTGYFLARGGAYYTCRACPSECIECEYYSSCTKCSIKNHYGRDCQSVCSKGCLNSTCEQLSGTCLCKDNYEGGHCNFCAKGKYGFDSNCTMDCPANCSTCITDKTCTECKDGFYGNTCDLSCQRGCYLGKCSQNNGTCFQNKCKPNFNGINCDQCIHGRYGNDCVSECPGKCVSCSSKTTCDNCKDGFWGETCQYNCSHGCSRSACLKQSGVCQDNECKSGFVGGKCDRCSSGRHGLNCNMNETTFGKESSANTIDFHTSLLAAVLFRFMDMIGTIFNVVRTDYKSNAHLAKSNEDFISERSIFLTY